MTAKDLQKMWHDLAVGMYYSNQAAENPKVFYHWEQQTLAAKLHWQAKAKAEVLAKIEVHVRGGVAYADDHRVEIIDHDNLEDEGRDMGDMSHTLGG